MGEEPRTMTTELQTQSKPVRKEAPAAVPKPAPADRCLALDAYRGFVMLAMVSAGLGMAHLVNDPWWGWLAHQMEHRPWEGCSFWDLIQPSFMFLVGASMPFAFARRRERGESWGRQFLHALRRAGLLIAIGVLLDIYADGKVYVQFIRVLQQIALGYLLAFFVLQGGPRLQALTAALILVLHPLAFLLYGHLAGVDPWNQTDNFGVWLDRLLHLPLSKGHYVTFNAFSSTATILFGVLAGELLMKNWAVHWKLLVLVAAGSAGILLGLALEPVVPLVKRIWTSSFALLAGGWTCLMLAAFYGITDGLQWRRWTFPLVVVGLNSIAIYVVAGVFKSNIQHLLDAFLKEPLLNVPKAAPVIMAVLVVVVEWLFCLWLYRKRIFFKV
jgi:heparan-alpha-glucosaminide N-acetyltransferase